MTKIFCRILRGSVYDTLRLYTFQRQRRRANQWRVTKKVVFNPRAGAIQKVNMSIIDQQTDQNNELFLSTPCSYYSYLSHSRSYLLFFLFDTCPVMNTKPILQATDALGWMFWTSHMIWLPVNTQSGAFLRANHVFPCKRWFSNLFFFTLEEYGVYRHLNLVLAV
jgi:hypothetical protein